MSEVKASLKPVLIPKTPEGLMGLQFFLVGVVVSVLMAGMFLWGMKIGYVYGLKAAGVSVHI